MVCPDINNFIRDLESELLNREYNGNQYNNVKRFLAPRKKQQSAKKKTWSDTEW